MAILEQGFFELHGICGELLSWYALFENVPNYDRYYEELVLIIIDPITQEQDLAGSGINFIHI